MMIVDVTVKESSSCEAAERNKRALYELELQWGSGKLDFGLLRRILSGEDRHDGAS
jgi:hypothetical protein